MTSREHAIEQVSLLQDPTRRALYDYVVSRPEAVGRDEAAEAAAVSRGLAAFHLDRLANAGLLDVEYRRISGRTGRGAGRPAKLYRPSANRVKVSIPETRYDLAGRVLVHALDAADAKGEGAAEAVARQAAREGEALARQLAVVAGPGPEVERAERALAELGYHPSRHGGVIRLRNCPFHALVEQNRELVCGLNHSLLSSLVRGLGCDGLVAEPDPEPDGCCVRVRMNGTASGD